jgi:hypothetical protein
MKNLTTALGSRQVECSATSLAGMEQFEPNAQSADDIRRICDRTAGGIAEKEKRSVIATADWVSDSPGDLTFGRGHIMVVSRSSMGTWGQGNCRSDLSYNEGFFAKDSE